MLLVRQGQLIKKQGQLAALKPDGDVNVCDGETCGGTNNPSIQLTITAADVDLPITWCGKTWIKSTESKGANDYYSGETACVCPSTYKKTRSAVPTASHKWAFGTSLVLQRNSYSGTFDQQNSLRLNPVGTVNVFDLWRYYLSTIYSSYNFLGFISNVPFATYSNYLITDAYFGSHTTGGVTYQWERGFNW
jgi:hypothetical protein